MKRCHPLMGHRPLNHDVVRVMDSLHPWNLLLHLMGCFSINLVVLAVVLLLSGEDFVIHVKDVFVPILSVPLEKTSALVCWISFKAGVRRCPFGCLYSLIFRSSLLRHDIYQADMFSSWDMIFCFQSGFGQICSCTVLIVASVLPLFGQPD